MILDTIFTRKESLSCDSSSSNWFVDWVTGGAGNAAGETVNEQTALTCAAFKAAVAIIAETMASLPLDVFQRTGNGGRRLAPQYWAFDLLHTEPNKKTSSFIWRETLQGHLGTYGNAYSVIDRQSNGVITSLEQRSPRPEETKPIIDDNDRLLYELHDKDGTNQEFIRPKDMLHIPGFGFDGIIGYNPVTLLREAIGGDLAAQRYVNELYANDGAPRGHYETTTTLSEPAYERMKKSFENLSDHGNRHKSPILEEGMKWATAHLKPEDVQMIETRKFGIEEIARFFRISPHLLQDLTHGTFSNITELGRQFIVFTMMPWLKRWQAEIDRKILGPGYFCEFNVNAFMQGDPKARSEYYKSMVFAGNMTRNEVRRLENYEDVGPDGDILFVPKNMIPLSMAVAGLQDDSSDGDQSDKDAEDQDDVGLTAAQVEKNLHCESVRTMLAGAIHRMLTKECKAAKRAAKNPSQFQVWRDGFYLKHKEICTEAFMPASAFLDVKEFVDAHIKWSKDDLLEAAECSPSELQDSVAACVDKWHEQRQHVPIGDE